METNMTTPMPPTPPTATTKHTANGVVYAKSITDTMYSFSCTFDSKLHKKVRKSIAKEFRKFSKDSTTNVLQKEIADLYAYRIELKATELKLEYKLYTTSKEKSKKQHKMMQRFQNLENALMNL